MKIFSSNRFHTLVICALIGLIRKIVYFRLFSPFTYHCRFQNHWPLSWLSAFEEKKSHEFYVKKYSHKFYMKYTWKEKTKTSLEIHTKRVLYINVHSFHFHVKSTRSTSNESTFRDTGIKFDGFISYYMLYNKRSYIYVGNASVCLLSDTFLFWSFNLRPLSIKSFLIDWFTFKIRLALIFDFSLIKETKVGVISKKLYFANITQITISSVLLTERSNYVEIKPF